MDSVYDTPAPTTTDPDAYLMPPGYIATLVNGRIVALPVAEPTTTPEPTPTTPQTDAAPAADPGLSLAVRQYVLYGSLATAAAGGAFWMVGEGLAAAAPAMAGAVHVLKWMAVFVGLVVAAVAAAKVRARANGATTMSLFHTTHATTKNTSIGRQVARGKSTFTNHF
ncbi:hypothetical protein [Kitasatospora sp. GAS1066B]|uniref:hypothetical protein n=1 Tax=Kitasatospora sp. GAS1066B TaxID=3156271 RepID=UPI003515FFF5